MSFVGSYRRAENLLSDDPRSARRLLRDFLVVLLLLAWWVVVLAWALVAYTVLLIPTLIWRSIRRRSREAERDRLRHQELLIALHRENQ